MSLFKLSRPKDPKRLKNSIIKTIIIFSCFISLGLAQVGTGSNTGSIKGVGLITGGDGVQYYYITFQNKALSVPGTTTAWGDAMIKVDTNPVTATAVYVSLTQALYNPTTSLNAIGGYLVAPISGYNRVCISQFIFVVP